MKYLSFGQVGDIPKCFICNNEARQTERTIQISSDLSVLAHDLCLKGFSGLLKLLGEQPRESPQSQIEKVIQVVEGKPILIRRDFPSQEMPILLYLYFHRDLGLRPSGEIYDWLENQRLGIKNARAIMIRLRKKNVVTVTRINESDQYLITDDGKRLVEKFLSKGS